jgi:cytochrome o ubiquinol oxidase subunit 2
MNSFFVPQLGSQIYTMSGMTTHLWLQADHTGIYPGLSANYSGEGFADMHFTVDAVPSEQFAQWVSAARDHGPSLDAAAYADLAKPSKAVAPFTYRSVATNLFTGILQSGMSVDVSPQFACSRSQRAEK